MNKKAKNLALCGAVLLGLLLLSEFFLRSYYVELQIFMSNADRKHRATTHYDEFVAAAQNAGVSEKTFNIYFLGESTMYGVPYGPFMSIPNIVDYRLGGSLRGQPVRVVNLAVSAKDVVYVHYMSELLFRKKEVFHPSLIVIYSGHNEFLKYHPTDPDFHVSSIVWLANHSQIASQLFTTIARSEGEILEIGLRDFFDHDILPFDRRGHDKVIDNYKKHILAMVSLTKKNSVPLIISTLVSNYADWEPNRSVFCNSAQARAQKQRFLQAFQDGREAEMQNDYGVALQHYQEALSICNSFVEAYFRQGKVYQALHRYEEARKAFQKAIDYDGMPIRAVSAQNDFIRSLDRFDHVKVVDSLTYLQNHAPNGLLDENLIIDGIHPSLEGYLLIGEAIAGKIHSLFSSGQNGLRPLNAETAKKIFNVDQSKMFDVYYNTGRWISRLATWRYDPTGRLELAEMFFRQAVEINPKSYEGYLGLAMVSFLRRDTPTAESFLQKARTYDAKSVDRYLQNPWIRKLTRRSNVKTSIPLHALS